MAAVEHGSLPPEPAGNKLFSAQVDRRKLLGFGFGVAGGLLLDRVGVDARELTSKIESSEPDYVRRIKEFGGEGGNEMLSFHDANTLAPLVAELFVNVVKPERFAEDILARTYFIR